MDDSTLIPMGIGIAVIILVGGLGLTMFKSSGTMAEDRLAGLTGNRKRTLQKKQDLAGGILARPAAIDLARPSFWTRLVPNAENLNLLYEQADVRFPFSRFMLIVVGMATAGAIFAVAFRLPNVAVPVTALVWGFLPFFG